MMNKITRRTTILTGAAATAIIATPAIASAEGKKDSTKVKIPTKGTTIVDKPLAKEKLVPAEIEELEIPSNVAPDEPNTVLQGAESRNIQEYATMVACSWKGDNPDSVEVRALSTKGKWSEWFKLDLVDEDGTPATEAAWVGPSTKVEVRAARNGEDITHDITAHLIATTAEDSDEEIVKEKTTGKSGGSVSADTENSATTLSTFSTLAATSSSSTLAAATTITPGYQAPTVYSRAYWGATESLSGTTYARDSLKAIFVHHTAGSNSYTQAQAPQQVRGMYEYHTKTLGWADLGYNAIIDKYGRIYEGRKGGLNKNIQGSHSRGFNKESFGISVMGNYSTISFTSATVESLSKLIGWKLSSVFKRDVNLKGSFYVSESNVKFKVGSTATINIISGHRDVNYTECPGNTAYKQMPTIRSKAQSYINSFFKGHYDAYVSAGGATKLGTVNNAIQSEGSYLVTRLTKGIVISTGTKSSKAYLSSFASDWTSAWGLPLESTSATTQRFQNGIAKKVNGKTTFTKVKQSFSDVPTTHPFYTEIEQLAAKGIDKGYSDGTYRPDQNAQRDAMIVLIYRAMGSPSYTPPKKSPYIDVSTKNKFYKEITWAYAKGISTGWTTKKGREFRPFATIDRDAMAAFLLRASGEKAPKAKQSFKDVSPTRIHAAAITWMKDTGISTGYSDGTYRPLKKVHRAAMAAFIVRWMEHTGRL